MALAKRSARHHVGQHIHLEQTVLTSENGKLAEMRNNENARRAARAEISWVNAYTINKCVRSFRSEFQTQSDTPKSRYGNLLGPTEEYLV